MKHAEHKATLKKLEQAYCIRDAGSHEPLGAQSPYHLQSLATWLYSDESAARAMASQMGKAYETTTKVTRVSGLWDFFFECARCGYEGILLDDKYSVRFFNRISDSDRTRPTLALLQTPTADDQSANCFFGRLGVVQPATGTTIPWHDYERFDKAAQRFVLYGGPLPKPIDPHILKHQLGEKELDVLMQRVESFLGPHVSRDGILPVFSSPTSADLFAKQHGLTKTNKHKLTSITLVDWLNTIEKIFPPPFPDAVLDPGMHRYAQGLFFRHNEQWMLMTAQGVWDIFAPRPTRKTDVIPPRPFLRSEKEDRSALHGLRSVIRLPFKRLMGADRAPLSDDDANELLRRELTSPFRCQPVDCSRLPDTDAFVMGGWLLETRESLAGESQEFLNANEALDLLIFRDLLEAARFVVNQLTSDSIPEALLPRHEAFIRAIEKVLMDALTTGYRIVHASQIMQLTRDVSDLQVTEFGYFGDLLFYGTADGSPLEERIDIHQLSSRVLDVVELHDTTMLVEARKNELLRFQKEKSKLLKQLNERRVNVQRSVELPAAVEQKLRAALGHAYASLQSDCRVIAATALETFQEARRRPNYDYAGISMKVSKLIERSLLIHVFQPWRKSMREQLNKKELQQLAVQTASETTDLTDKHLVDWLRKRNKLELGKMRYCLRRARKPETSRPALLLAEFLHKLHDGEWLASPCVEQLLHDVSTKYRNGGVHQRVVTYDLCHEAMHRILLGPDPALKRLLESTCKRA